MNGPVTKVLQVHNVHSGGGGYGGADLVIENERRLLESNGVRVQQLLPTTVELSPGSGLRTAQAMVMNSGARRRLQDAIDESAPDVVHFHTVFPLLSPEVFRVNVPPACVRVVTLHSYRFSCLAATHLRAGEICTDCVGKIFKLAGVRHRCYHNSLGASAAAMAALAVHRARRTLNGSIDSFFALTPFQASLLEAEGIDRHRIQVKPNFLFGTYDKPFPMAQRKGVLFVGRLNEEKGVEQLVQAWEQGMAPCLTIAGDGPLRSRVESAAARVENIKYLGPVAPTEVHRLLIQARMVIFPSLWFEGMPMVLLEALALGCPIVVSDIANLRSIVAPEVMLPFDVGSVAGLRNAIEGKFDELDALSAMSSAGYAEFVTRYSGESALPQLLAAYENARQNRMFSTSNVTAKAPGR